MFFTEVHTAHKTRIAQSV